LTQQPPAPPDQPEQQDTQQDTLPDQAEQQDKADQPQQEERPEPEELPEQPVAAPPPPPPPPKAPPKKRRVGLIVALTVLGALAVVAIGGVVLVNLLREDLPQVGDCMTDGATADDMEVVACDSPEAAWNVIGSDGTWTWGDFNAAAQGELCQGFSDTDQALWVSNATSVEDATEGEVVCLAPIGGGEGTTDQ
jgi:hypothetical protein